MFFTVFCRMATNTELIRLVEDSDLAGRVTTMTLVTFTLDHRLMGELLKQAESAGAMRIMTKVTPAGHSKPLVFLDKLLGITLMTTNTELINALRQQRLAITGMGIMTFDTTPVGKRGMHKGAAERFLVMTRKTDIIAFGLKQFIIGPVMHVMTSGAETGHQRCMHMFLVAELPQILMTGQAEIGFVTSQIKTADQAVGQMADLAVILLDRGVNHAGLELFRHLLMTGYTFLAFRLLDLLGRATIQEKSNGQQNGHQPTFFVRASDSTHCPLARPKGITAPSGIGQRTIQLSSCLSN